MRQTPCWGEIEVADAHVHFFSPAFFESLAQQEGVPEVGSHLGWETPESLEYLADRWVIELNHHGVDRALLIASIPGDIESVGFAVNRHPERFRGVAMVQPLLDGADLRCASALSDGQIHGIFLFPAMHRYSLHDARVLSVLATVAAYPGAFVYVHCGMLSVGFRRKLGLPCPFDMRYSNPIDLHAVALEFPRLPFVIPHFGAGYLREAPDGSLSSARSSFSSDTSSSNTWMKSDPGGLDLETVFRRTLEVTGPNRLLFGTDSSWFPRGWIEDVFDAQVRGMEKAGVGAEAARAIFGSNFRRLTGFGLQ